MYVRFPLTPGHVSHLESGTGSRATSFRSDFIPLPQWEGIWDLACCIRAMYSVNLWLRFREASEKKCPPLCVTWSPAAALP